jgi:hypothetical protein
MFRGNTPLDYISKLRIILVKNITFSNFEIDTALFPDRIQYQGFLGDFFSI